MARVGFLGLGTMGQAMATRLIEAGHEVLAWNRSGQPRDLMKERGAQPVDSPAEALATDVSISMLANDAAVDNVLSLDHFPPHRIVHANMASVSPDMCRVLSERFVSAGHGYVSAPVLGRPNLAAEGGLNILAAGDSADIAAVQPFFDAVGTRTWPLGPEPTTANLVKIAVNYNIIHAIQALAESIALTTPAGVKPHDFVDLLTNTLFGGVVYSGYGNLVAERAYLPQAFSLQLGLKDLGLAEGAAESAGITLPTSAVLREQFTQAISDDELVDKDWSAIAEVTLRQSDGARGKSDKAAHR